MSDLPIVLPIKEEVEDEWAEGIHENLPKPPSVICIYAAFRSGKSVLVNNLILNPTMFRGLLDKWYVVSPTAMNDSSCRFLLEEEGVSVIDDYSDEWLNGLLHHQYETDKEDRDRIGVVFDDAIQYLQSRTSPGNYLATRFRHYNIKYLIYVSQSFRAIDTKVRGNSKAVIIMKIANLKELQKLDEEYGGMMDDRFMEFYNFCLNDQPYSFMYINIDANPVEVFLRFERKIFPQGEVKEEGAEEEDIEECA